MSQPIAQGLVLSPEFRSTLLEGLDREHVHAMDHIALQLAGMPAVGSERATIETTDGAAAADADPEAAEPPTGQDHLPPGTITTPDLANGSERLSRVEALLDGVGR